MHVLVSGSGGLLGRHITRALELRGDSVSRLVRPGGTSVDGDVEWDIDAGTIDAVALEEGRVDCVVHLAGEPIVGRWTSEKRERILRSRVDGTRLLAEALAGLAAPPSVFACASAVGYYGDGGDRLLVETSPRGGGFLADVVEQWEQSADAARAAGIRTVHLRMGAVQSPEGGALAKLLPLFRMGLGGPVGSGDQHLAWIGLQEAIGVWLYVLGNDDADGPINVVGPTPCTNREHARALARVLHRPAVMPVPAFALKAVLGQLGEELVLYSQKVAPMRLEGLGYEFGARHIEEALRIELGRPL